MVPYPYPFFVVIAQLFSWIIYINGCIYILTGSPVYIFFMIVYVIKKIGGNDNYRNSLNIMVNCHYHEKQSNCSVIPVHGTGEDPLYRTQQSAMESTPREQKTVDRNTGGIQRLWVLGRLKGR